LRPPSPPRPCSRAVQLCNNRSTKHAEPVSEASTASKAAS
jgi:hypothetical protein